MTDTGVKAAGTDGNDGQDGQDGQDGEDGKDGLTPYIGGNGNWWIGMTDTGVKAAGTDGNDGQDGKDGQDGQDGEDGKDGLTPYIGENGNWWIGTNDTGVKAQGNKGETGATGAAGVSITRVEINAYGEMLIYFSNGTSTNLGRITVPNPGPDIYIPLTGIAIDKTQLSLLVGQQYSFTVGFVPSIATNLDVTWESSNPEVVSVDENGRIIALAIGNATVTVTSADGGFTRSCSVTVTSSVFTYTLSTAGDAYFVSGYQGYEKNVVIPHIYDGLRVIGITSSAFRGNIYIESITIPNSIEEIGAYAFQNCVNLKQVLLSSGLTKIDNYTFMGCTSLESITLTDNIGQIGMYAFANCSNLTEIRLSDSLTIISQHAFDSCVRLNNLILPDGITTIEDGAFRHAESLTEIIFPSSVTSIGVAAFQYCIALESVDLHEGITLVNSSAFSYCTSLKTLSMHGNFRTFGHSVFYECRSLETVYYNASIASALDTYNYIFYNAGIDGNGITLTIGADAVPLKLLLHPSENNNLPKIVKIVLEDGVTTFMPEEEALSLPYLTEIDLPDTLQDITYSILNDSAWWDAQADGAVYIGNILYGYKGNTIRNLVIRDDVTLIARHALKDATEITSLQIPYLGTSLTDTTNAYLGYLFGATSSSGHAEYVPASLQSVKLTAATAVGSNAFVGCTSLTEVVIPDTVTSISGGAFSGCAGLESITLPFVGNTAKTSTYGGGQYPFGYIFGTVSYTGGVATQQTFYSYSNYTSTTTYYIPVGLKSVTVTGGNYVLQGAFSDCSKLTSITLHENLLQISAYAFDGCGSLSNIVIPESVTYIGNYAFRNCNNLAILCRAEAKPSNWSANWNSSNRPVYWGYNGTAYTYTFETYGGSTVDPITSSLAIVLPTLEKEGMIFAGWYDNEALEGDPVSSPYYGANNRLYAKWTDDPSYPNGSSFERAMTIEVGTVYDVEITTAGQYVYYSFTAPQTRSYTFSSGGDLDTFGYLNDSNRVEITYNDDHDGANFSITETLTAGEKYYLIVRLYSSEATGSFTITVSEN